MIVINKIEYIETDCDVFEIERMITEPSGRPMELATSDGDSKFIDISTTIEIVRGCKFHHYTTRYGHKSIHVGMAKEVQDVLGMQYEYVSTMNDRAKEDAERVAKAETKLNNFKLKISNASLIGRIKWVFTGVMI